jgi:soluble lytic murein transglycosylase-like protein
MQMFFENRISSDATGAAASPAPRIGLASAALFFVLYTQAHAGGVAAKCFEEASTRFGHKNPKVLRAMTAQESSGRCPQRHPANANGSYDIGCMGINSSWLPTLQNKFGITERDLYDPCTNIHVGAWIYAKNVRQFGDNWRAVGAYNAKSEHKRIKYAWKINAQLAAIP